VEKYGRAGQATEHTIIRRMRFAYWITKATDTHSEYVIRIAFRRHQWLRERASTLHYTHTSFYFRITCSPCTQQNVPLEPTVQRDVTSQFGSSTPTFRRNMRPPFTNYTRRHIAAERSLQRHECRLLGTVAVAATSTQPPPVSRCMRNYS
jgi:hypothetical protein